MANTAENTTQLPPSNGPAVAPVQSGDADGTRGAVSDVGRSARTARPRWMRDLLRFLPLKSQFVLSGNVRDLQAYEIAPGTVGPVPLEAALAGELYDAGFGHVVGYDAIRGFRQLLPGGAAQPAGPLVTRWGVPTASGAGLDSLENVLDRLVEEKDAPIALLVDFASRLVVRSASLQAAEHRLFTRALVLSHSTVARPVGPTRRPFFNTVIWIVEKEGDLPDWLLIGNPRIRHIPVARPDHIARRALAPSLLSMFPGAAEATAEEMFRAERDFVDETEGLLLVDLNAIAQLGRAEYVNVAHVSDAVRRYKVGVTEDPWQKLDRAKIRAAADYITARVKGQDHAVVHMLDIVKRAVTGVGGLRRGGRPRGVAFLAGPTGVGKTELAKTVTSLLFGDESAYIRFDMSEFSAEHADQRLIGAPPGYVGYDVGGELTNAIREKPFSVVLFDEIEKAHPRILDKFLQILDDGVLSSGRGDRVYFSEALIIFTSNLGIYRMLPDGERVANVTPDDSLEMVHSKVRAEIERHFKVVLNRPEILNRIGENIIVFDFIRASVAGQIFQHMVTATLSDVATRSHRVTLTDSARSALETLCLEDLSNGGRGIRNKVEVHLVNPLARALFDINAAPGESYLVRAIEPGSVTRLTMERVGTT